MKYFPLLFLMFYLNVFKRSEWELLIYCLIQSSLKPELTDLYILNHKHTQTYYSGITIPPIGQWSLPLPLGIFKLYFPETETDISSIKTACFAH